MPCLQVMCTNSTAMEKLTEGAATSYSYGTIDVSVIDPELERWSTVCSINCMIFSAEAIFATTPTLYRLMLPLNYGSAMSHRGFTVD